MRSEYAAGRPVAPLSTFALLLLSALLLSACAGTPERMTRAALSGDKAALDDLVKPGSPDIDMPFTFEAANPGCPGYRTLTPLQAAACAGREDAVRSLVAAKASIDLDAGAGTTPLVLAVLNGRDDVARLLVSSGARLESTDAAGSTPLLLALARRNSPLADFLLRNGASPKARNLAGETALLLSTDLALSKALVGLGADPLAVTAQGDSGLHLAARYGVAGTARLFLERGVDPRLRNLGGATALDVARSASGAPLAGGSGLASAAAAKAAAVRSAARRGFPGEPAPALDPGLARGRSEVAAVIGEWIDRSVRDATALADGAASAGRPDEALSLYVAALEKADGAGPATEDGLRARIVQFAASLAQPPAFPEKAREHLVRSQYLLKKGQDISLVEAEVAAAVRLAPWWAEGYYNLGQIQAERGNHDTAERNLEVYVASAAPGDPRAQAAQDRIYEIGMAREEEGKIRSMAGSWTDDRGRGYSVSISGDRISIHGPGLSFSLSQRNGAIEGNVQGGAYGGGHGCTIPSQMHPVTGRLAPDARSMTLAYQWNQYKTSFHWVNMAGVPVRGNCLTCDEVCDAVTVSRSDQVNLTLRAAATGRTASPDRSGGRPSRGGRPQ